ncbi:hypothetical protein A2961_00075 [Candidatus Woesebacteria bacterium RIFCSPLOWO2_01_FULL_39_21]|uniref:Uncharacterized protein n=1 Tax=Candidatus Woesebacteria bacterium RIFCSPLOWO2_01_FULL_39_21 TaxID=1802519 RepID=A0A1F8BIH0_9BACT|nr:MAG: hypothetical protein A2691_00320 [Candidatus Woesebacteria bacterium RIFCSPHIGHO2_01_FULL_39_23]OGM63857.1 MAG: hypothetical protein A2961_00075 [Candidatus Woesebacteria bacterium RIFCSPLOWO2_01_FULL_39_21]
MNWESFVVILLALSLWELHRRVSKLEKKLKGEDEFDSENIPLELTPKLKKSYEKWLKKK